MFVNFFCDLLPVKFLLFSTVPTTTEELFCSLMWFTDSEVGVSSCNPLTVKFFLSSFLPTFSEVYVVFVCDPLTFICFSFSSVTYCQLGVCSFLLSPPDSEVHGISFCDTLAFKRLLLSVVTYFKLKCLLFLCVTHWHSFVSFVLLWHSAVKCLISCVTDC